MNGDQISHQPETKQPRCSFCSKSGDDVRVMVSGRGDTVICDECVVYCLRVVGRSPGQWNLRLAYSAFEAVASIGYSFSRIFHRRDKAGDSQA
jgi:hypothetical protein